LRTRRSLFGIHLGMEAFPSSTRIVYLRSDASRKKVDFSVKGEISASCIGRSSDVIKDFFSECQTEYLKLVKKKTSIFGRHNGEWKKTMTMDTKQLDTVILNEEKKTALLDDVKFFLDLQSQAWYQGRGVVRISAALPELALFPHLTGSGRCSSFMHAFSSMVVHLPLLPA
jgi:hypothetical protein